MKDKECISGKRFFTCKGKLSHNPCVNYEDRHKEDQERSNNRWDSEVEHTQQYGK